MARTLKVLCIAMVILLAIMATIVVALSLTVFKPKQPEITAQPIGLENVRFGLSPNNSSSDIVVGMVVTVENPNYGGFEYENSVAIISYRGVDVGEVLMERRKIPSRTKVSITGITNIAMDKLIAAQGFVDDFMAGHLEMVSSAKLPGKVIVLKIVRFPATVHNTCRINIIIESQSANTKCITRIKFL